MSRCKSVLSFPTATHHRWKVSCTGEVEVWSQESYEGSRDTDGPGIADHRVHDVSLHHLSRVDESVMIKEVKTVHK